ncbi:MAG: hypothetical protein GX535_08215, partial [Xanthomonadaceae bacterium]|nr:hypothetical protein [Xanthomonadaceae bacterium]
QWFRPRLEDLGDTFRGRKLVALDFEREDLALRILFDLAEEATVVSPQSLRKKLHKQAARVLAATA